MFRFAENIEGQSTLTIRRTMNEAQETTVDFPSTGRSSRGSGMELVGPGDRDGKATMTPDERGSVRRRSRRRHRERISATIDPDDARATSSLFDRDDDHVTLFSKLLKDVDDDRTPVTSDREIRLNVLSGGDDERRATQLVHSLLLKENSEENGSDSVSGSAAGAVVLFGSWSASWLPVMWVIASLMEPGALGLAYLSLLVLTCLIPTVAKTSAKTQGHEVAEHENQASHSSKIRVVTVLRISIIPNFAIHILSCLIALGGVTLATIHGSWWCHKGAPDLRNNSSTPTGSGGSSDASGGSISEGGGGSLLRGGSQDSDWTWAWNILGITGTTGGYQDCTAPDEFRHAWMHVAVLLMSLAGMICFVVLRRSPKEVSLKLQQFMFPLSLTPSGVVLLFMRLAGRCWLVWLVAMCCALYRPCVAVGPLLGYVVVFVLEQLLARHSAQPSLNTRVARVVAVTQRRVALLYTACLCWMFFSCLALSRVSDDAGDSTSLEDAPYVLQLLAAADKQQVHEVTAHAVLAVILLYCQSIHHILSSKEELELHCPPLPNRDHSELSCPPSYSESTVLPKRVGGAWSPRWSPILEAARRVSLHAWYVLNSALLFALVNSIPSAMGIVWLLVWIYCLWGGSSSKTCRWIVAASLLHLLGVFGGDLKVVASDSKTRIEELIGLRPLHHKAYVLSVQLTLLAVYNLVVSSSLSPIDITRSRREVEEDQTSERTPLARSEPLLHRGRAFYGSTEPDNAADTSTAPHQGEWICQEEQSMHRFDRLRDTAASQQQRQSQQSSSHRPGSGIGPRHSLVKKVVTASESVATRVFTLVSQIVKRYFYLVALLAMFAAAVAKVNALHIAFLALFVFCLIMKRFSLVSWGLVSLYSVTLLIAQYSVTSFVDRSAYMVQIGFEADDSWSLWPYFLLVAVFLFQFQLYALEHMEEFSDSVRNILETAERVSVGLIVWTNVCLLGVLASSSEATLFGFTYLVLFFTSMLILLDADSFHTPATTLYYYWYFVLFCNGVCTVSVYAYQLYPSAATQLLGPVLASSVFSLRDIGVEDTSPIGLWPKIASFLLCLVQLRAWANRRRKRAKTSIESLEQQEAEERRAQEGDEEWGAGSGVAILLSLVMGAAKKFVLMLSIYAQPIALCMSFIGSAFGSGAPGSSAWSGQSSVTQLGYFAFGCVISVSQRCRASVTIWRLLQLYSGIATAASFVLQLPLFDKGWNNADWSVFLLVGVNVATRSRQWYVLWPHIGVFTAASLQASFQLRADRVKREQQALPTPPPPTVTPPVPIAVGEDGFGELASSLSATAAARQLVAEKLDRVLDVMFHPARYIRFFSFHFSMFAFFINACIRSDNIYGLLYLGIGGIAGYCGKNSMSKSFRWFVLAIVAMLMMMCEFIFHLRPVPPGPDGPSSNVPYSEQWLADERDASKHQIQYFELQPSATDLMLTMLVWCTIVLNFAALQAHENYSSLYGIRATLQPNGVSTKEKLSVTDRLRKTEAISLARRHGAMEFFKRLLPLPEGRTDFTKSAALKDRIALGVYIRSPLVVLVAMFLHALYDGTTDLSLMKVCSLSLVLVFLQNMHRLPWRGNLWWRVLLFFHMAWFSLRVVMYIPRLVQLQPLVCAAQFIGVMPNADLFRGTSLREEVEAKVGNCYGTPYNKVEFGLQALILVLSWAQYAAFEKSDFIFVLHFLNQQDTLSKAVGGAIRRSRLVVIEEARREQRERWDALLALIDAMDESPSAARNVRESNDDYDETSSQSSGTSHSSDTDGTCSPAEDTPRGRERSPHRDENELPTANSTGSAIDDDPRHVLDGTIDARGLALLANIDESASSRTVRRFAVKSIPPGGMASPRDGALQSQPVPNTSVTEFDTRLASTLFLSPSESLRESRQLQKKPKSPTMWSMLGTSWLNIIDSAILWFDRHSVGSGAVRLEKHDLPGNRTVLLVVRAYRCLFSYTDLLCYLLYSLQFALAPCALNAVLPISVFSYAAAMNPRPHRGYWRVCLVYLQCLILVKCLVKMGYCDPRQSSTEGAGETDATNSLYETSWLYGRTCTSGFFLVDTLFDLMCVLVTITHTAYLRSWGLWCDVELTEGGSGGVDEQHQPVTLRRSTSQAKSTPEKRSPSEPPSALLSSISAAARGIVYNVTRDDTKLGIDLYRYSFACELLAMLLIFFGYYKLVGSTDTLVNSIMSSLLPGSLAVCVLLLFLFIVTDRIVYLSRKASLRFALNIFYSVLYHAVLIWWFCHQTTFVRTYYRNNSFGVHGSLGVASSLYVLKCMYLYLNGVQVRRGVMPYMQHIAFTGTYSSREFTLYMISRLTPFVFDMRVILDWAVTPTALKLPYWMKVEDAAHELYSLMCDKEDSKAALAMNKGEKNAQFPGVFKYSIGWVLFALLAAVLLFPIFLYSSFSPMLTQNFVEECTVQLSLEGSPPLWSSANMLQRDGAPAPLAPFLLNATVRELLERTRPSLVGTGLTTSTTQQFPLSVFSSALWAISPPALAEMIKLLNASSSAATQVQQISLVLTTTIRSKDTDTKISTMNQQYPLDSDTKGNLTNLLLGRSNSSWLPRLYTPFLYNRQGSGGSSLFEAYSVGDNRRNTVDCVLWLVGSNGSTDGGSSSSYFSLKCSPLFEKSNPYPGPWVLSPQERSCLEANACPNYEDNGAPSKRSALTSPALVIESTAVLGASWLQSIGLVAAYTTFVLAVGRVLRFATTGGAYRTAIEDMEAPDQLLQMLELMHVARSLRRFAVESRLYAAMTAAIQESGRQVQLPTESMA